MFGIEPFIAMLSYSTGESGKGEDVERVKEATRLVKERRPDLKVEGPIQYDAAVDAGVAESKLPGSEVAGRATVFIFPDLNTGNNTYKAVQRSARHMRKTLETIEQPGFVLMISKEGLMVCWVVWAAPETMPSASP